MSGNRRQWGVVGGVVLLLALMVGAGWMARGRFLPVAVGSRAPEVTAVTLDGDSVRLSDLRGKVVLLNVWATWCPPCRQEMPSMERLHRLMGHLGLEIVALSIDAGTGKADEFGAPGGDVAGFVHDNALTFTVWHQPGGEVRRAYRTTGVPESFLIGRDGRIRKRVVGAKEWDDSATIAEIRTLLEE
jgi:cytochrome c biogenesis protein CcmG/thiol:disulfide interchange protein DsbE